MNLFATARKLQTALCQQGMHYKINQVQSYSPRAERMVTKYLLIETKEVNDRRVNTTILETYSLVDVVKMLAALYGGG